MGIDTARLTYDETKQYRRVVHQQGRVVLEADTNEASQILTEDARWQGIDVIGPAGVPTGSEGYAIAFDLSSPPPAEAGGAGATDSAAGPTDSADSVPIIVTDTAASTSPRDLTIGAGTLYVGGWRVTQEQPDLRYSTQSNYDWVSGPDAPNESADFELVYLRLREQEVSAVEDTTLLEPALGGPDTSQRVRLVRRVQRYAPALGNAKLADIKAFWPHWYAWWKTQGLSFQLIDHALKRDARLSVTVPGYAGRENQMIRVQIADGASRILWAYDDASALHGVDLQMSDLAKKILAITPPPVDAHHQPKVGQTVEILVAAARLDDDGNYAAEVCGLVTQVAGAYQPDTGTITVQDLPQGIADANGTPTVAALFVRIWEAAQEISAGVSQPLVDRNGGDTGIRVKLTGAAFVPGDYWAFAVRPATPTSVFPARYAMEQPPEGPREWLCPLALIDWRQDCAQHLDLRPPFDSLTALRRLLDGDGGCIEVDARDGELALRRAVETARSVRKYAHRGCVSICLRPGTYQLTEPIVLNEGHSGLTFEGRDDSVVFQAAPGAEQRFDQGMFHLVHAHNVTFRGIRFEPPRVTRSEGELDVKIGLRTFGCKGLTVHGCSFVFGSVDARLFGAGIFAGGHAKGLEVRDSTFLVEEHGDQFTHYVFGYLHTHSTGAAGVAEGRFVRGRLTEASFRRNTFRGLTASALMLADLGEIVVESNRGHDVFGGFWILATNGSQSDGRKPAEHALKWDHPFAMAEAAIRHALLGGYVAEVAPSEHMLSLHFTQNIIHARGGPALHIWHHGTEARGLAVISANHLTSFSRLPVALIASLHSAAINGNAIINPVDGAASLYIEAVSNSYAVTGNLLGGKPTVPNEEKWLNRNEYA